MIQNVIHILTIDLVAVGVFSSSPCLSLQQLTNNLLRSSFLHTVQSVHLEIHALLDGSCIQTYGLTLDLAC